MSARLVSFLVAGSMCLTAPAFAQDVALAAPNPIQVLDDCVSGHAKRLEISGEAANVVADAAVAECARELTAATRGAGMLRAGGPTRDDLKSSMRDAALVQIVELRAERNTPKPPPQPPAKPIKVKKKPAP